jgi:hypothetical protein
MTLHPKFPDHEPVEPDPNASLHSLRYRIVLYGVCVLALAGLIVWVAV